ncbi:hypothetical protein BH24BAC1_BH24BAC1_16180 [soil metagenome]
MEQISEKNSMGQRDKNGILGGILQQKGFVVLCIYRLRSAWRS